MAEKRNPTRVEKTSEQIIRFIIEHKMLPGDKLPTEEEFLAVMDVSRGTLRESVKVLAARNILEIRQGAGTFISHKKGSSCNQPTYFAETSFSIFIFTLGQTRPHPPRSVPIP